MNRNFAQVRIGVSVAHGVFTLCTRVRKRGGRIHRDYLFITNRTQNGIIALMPGACAYKLYEIRQHSTGTANRKGRLVRAERKQSRKGVILLGNSMRRNEFPKVFSRKQRTRQAGFFIHFKKSNVIWPCLRTFCLLEQFHGFLPGASIKTKARPVYVPKRKQKNGLFFTVGSSGAPTATMMRMKDRVRYSETCSWSLVDALPHYLHEIEFRNLPYSVFVVFN